MIVAPGRRVCRAKRDNEDMRPLAVHHVSINVDDVGAARDFYTGVLGLTERSDRPDFAFGGAWLDAGGQQVHLIEGRPPAPVGQHFALQVEDLAATVTELRGRGLDVGDPRPVGKSLQTFVSDPCGNVVELHEVGGAA
jgi:glyoxylase I family protein